MPFFVYIVENPSGMFYIGQTEDLDRRVQEHKDATHGRTKYTTKHAGPWTPVWHEAHPDRASAMAREHHIATVKSAR